MKVDNFEDCLDDLAVRFLLYLPADQSTSFDRLGFHIEQAYWFYCDMYQPSNPSSVCPSLSLRAFAPHLLSRTPDIAAQFGNLHNISSLVDDFFAYKAAVPVCGCCLINQAKDKVLMVRGWNKQSKWGFPKGKIGKDETPGQCARRECLEECGFDVGPMIDDQQPFIDLFLKNHPIRLYVVFGVDEQFKFQPRTRNEIGAIAWHYIADLPDRKNHANCKYYYNVLPFVRKLKEHVREAETAERLEAKGIKKQKERNEGKGNRGKLLSINELMKKAASKEDLREEGEEEEEEEGENGENEELELESDSEKMMPEIDHPVPDQHDLEPEPDILMDLKPVWIGKLEDKTDSAMLLEIFKKGKTATPPPPPPQVHKDAHNLLSILKKSPKMISQQQCLNRLGQLIPAEGLSETKLNEIIKHFN